jgi:hypothetical protein
MEGVVADSSWVHGGSNSRKFGNGLIWWTNLPTKAIDLSHYFPKIQVCTTNFVFVEIGTNTKTTCVISHIFGSK